MTQDIIEIQTPLTDETVDSLRAGEQVVIDGILYTARDAAHARLAELIDAGKDLPFLPAGQVIYYVGPAPPAAGRPFGSAGPTTAARMDPHTPKLLAKGLKGMIGKGPRSAKVQEAVRRYKAVYFAAIGGIGALLSACIREAEVVAYPDLGPEAIRRIRVENFPAIVAIDAAGRTIWG